VNIIVSSLTAESFLNGWDIIKAGQCPEHIYFIKQNCVTIVNEKENIRIADLKEGSYFGEGAIIFGVPSAYTYKAIDYLDKEVPLTKLFSMEAN
jgi:CRP-like cAMP-binding protein